MPTSKPITWENNDWYEYTSRIAKLYSYKLGRVYKILSPHDWEDFEAKAIHRVWSKRELCKKDVSLKPWIYRVVMRSMYGSIQKALFLKIEKKNRFFRQHLHRPTSIISKIVEEEDGREEISYEPNISIYQSNNELREEILSRLNKKEEEVFQYLYSGFNQTKIAEMTKSNQHTIHKIVKSIRNKYKNTINDIHEPV